RTRTTSANPVEGFLSHRISHYSRARQTVRRSMQAVHCKSCGAFWAVPDALDIGSCREIASQYRAHNTITAIKLLRDHLNLTLHAAKAVLLHISGQAGKCHRCGAQLADEGSGVCCQCKSVNYNW